MKLKDAFTGRPVPAIDSRMKVSASSSNITAVRHRFDNRQAIEIKGFDWSERHHLTRRSAVIRSFHPIEEWL